MSKAHYLAPLVPQAGAYAVRLGDNTGQFSVGYDEKKFVKLTAESRYELCAAGDPIEGAIVALQSATSGGYSVGSIYKSGRIWATADGLEATPGTGTLAIGDYVVCGTVVALGTAISGFAKVCKATNQPGTAVVSTLAGADTAAAVKTVLDAALVKVADAEKNALHAWRVVSLGTAGTGAVGTTVLIERVNAGE
jgi:hypothetical protein